MKNQFAFLSSNRFYALAIASASAILVDPNFQSQPWYVSLGKFLGLLGVGFTTVGTLDRSADKKVEAAKASLDNGKKKKV